MTSAELLELFNDLTGRAATDVITDVKKYTWLSRAEKEVITDIARIKPSILYPKVGTASLPQLVTTDRNVFTFGDDGAEPTPNPIIPFGRVQIYRSIRDVPDRPWRPDYDYLDEGSQIRLPRNRTHTGTLYYRGIVMPPAITGGDTTTDPVTLPEHPHLLPTDASELTAIRAARNFAEGGNIRNAALADRMRARWAERYPVFCLLWKQQFSYGGALVSWSAKDLVTPLL